MKLVNSSQDIVISSEHPIVFEWLHDIIASNPPSCGKVRRYSRTITAGLHPPALLILDCCSNMNWPDIAIRWQRWGGTILCLISPEPINWREQLRALYLGACGIVPISPNFRKELPVALQAILRGELWYSQRILEAHIKREKAPLDGRLSSPETFTIREEQIVSFLMRKFRNKQIADALGISERTVKYHVTNILRKSQVSTRSELLRVMAADPVTTESAGQRDGEMIAS